jgi:hypothetical protein
LTANPANLPAQEKSRYKWLPVVTLFFYAAVEPARLLLGLAAIFSGISALTFIGTALVLTGYRLYPAMDG